MVDCARFLDEYSEFRDGLLSPEESREFEAHLAACPACARYDQVVDRGAGIFRDLPGLTPSDDFAARLQHRIFHLEDELRVPDRRLSGVPTPAVLSIAAVLAMAAFLPVLRPVTDGLYSLPAVSARAPGADLPQLFVAGPLLAHAAVLHGDPEPAAAQARDNHLLFRYYPIGVPVTNPVAMNVLPAN